MHRRELLRHAFGAAVFASLGLLGLPRQAVALGGQLPELDAAAPDFTLPGFAPGTAPDPAAPERDRRVRSGQFRLADFRGQWLVLYFYPKDFTGGCTLEARGFQRDLELFHGAGAEVVGVSADGPDSHAAFCSEEGLAFPLLSDPGGAVSQRYGSWLAPFSQRHTFLIDPAGVLRARWVAVRPVGHSQEVLAELARQQSRLS